MYNVDYNDERFTKVENEKTAALNEVENTYNNMISESDSKYQSLIDETQTNANKQAELQQQQTDLALEKIDAEKKKAQDNYTKEQKASYADYMKESNRFGGNAEQMAANGLTNTGYSETSQVAMFTEYQNRIATAKSSLNDTMTQYTLASKDAILQNSSALLQIYSDAALKKAEYTLEAFQYKNNLLQQQLNAKQTTENTYYQRYQDVLSQINTENSLAEQVRQYNESLAFQKQQAAQEQANWEKEYNLSVQNSNSSGSGSSGSTGKLKSDNSISNVKLNNSASTKAKSDYYFKTSDGSAGYQPRYINNQKISKSGLTLKDLGTISGVSGNKNIWKGVDSKGNTAYYVWDEDHYLDITSYMK